MSDSQEGGGESGVFVCAMEGGWFGGGLIYWAAWMGRGGGSQINVE